MLYEVITWSYICSQQWLRHNYSADSIHDLPVHVCHNHTGTYNRGICRKNEILQKYPPKLAKKRAKSLVINDPEQEQEILANVRTIPGIITP